MHALLHALRGRCPDPLAQRDDLSRSLSRGVPCLRHDLCGGVAGQIRGVLGAAGRDGGGILRPGAGQVRGILGAVARGVDRPRGAGRGGVLLFFVFVRNTVASCS